MEESSQLVSLLCNSIFCFQIYVVCIRTFGSFPLQKLPTSPWVSKTLPSTLPVCMECKQDIYTNRTKFVVCQDCNGYFHSECISQDPLHMFVCDSCLDIDPSNCLPDIHDSDDPQSCSKVSHPSPPKLSKEEIEDQLKK